MHRVGQKAPLTAHIINTVYMAILLCTGVFILTIQKAEYQEVIALQSLRAPRGQEPLNPPLLCALRFPAVKEVDSATPVLSIQHQPES